MRRAEHVVLINLPSPWLISDTDQPPLGLLALAASLREHGISVEICDLAGQDMDQAQVPKGDLYGIGFATPQYGIAKRLTDWLALQRDSLIVLGGPHCSALPRRTFRELQSDVVFAGEADWALVDYVMGRDVREIPGATWETGDGAFVVNPMPCVQVDLLPMPARDLIDMDKYMKVKTYTYVGGGTREGYVATGRGCPYNCAFCAQRCVTMGQVRWRTIPQVMDEVRLLKHRYGCDQLSISDDTFNLKMDRVTAFCESIRPLNMGWQCLLRADLTTKEVVETLHGAGCRAVVFGFESGSDKILRAMQKGFTVEQSLVAADLAQKAGLTVRAQMIVGFPGETDETIAMTEHAVRTAPVDKWGFHIYSPLPGSPAWKNPENYGLEIDRESVDFDHGFTTVGRPGEWDEAHIQAREWLNYLTAIADGKNIYEGAIPG